MKKLVLFLALLGFGFKAQAVSVSDIDSIVMASYEIYDTANELLSFAIDLRNFRDKNFTFQIAKSTQEVSITNAQRQGLLVKYENLKDKLKTQVNQLP